MQMQPISLTEICLFDKKLAHTLYTLTEMYETHTLYAKTSQV